MINNLNNSVKFEIDELYKLRAFNGTCQDSSDEKQDIKNIDTTNSHSCYKECEITQGCTAITYHYNKTDLGYCDLHSGGPYTKGSGVANQTCYLMPKGICSDVLGIHASYTSYLYRYIITWLSSIQN